MTTLHREASFETRRRHEERGHLIGVGALSPFEQTGLAVRQVKAALHKLTDRLKAAGIDAPSVDRVDDALEHKPGVPKALRREIEDLHTEILFALSSADAGLGKAYAVGRGLADTALQVEDRASFEHAFGSDLLPIKNWLADLATAFPAHSSRSVSLSLRTWELWAADPKLDRDPVDWSTQVAGIRAALRRQGELWRELLVGEKHARDMLKTTDYLQAARGLLGRTLSMIGRFWPFTLLVLLFAALLGGGVALFALMGGDVARTIGALAAAAGAVGITGAGIRARLSQGAMQLEARLWGAELDLAIGQAVLIGPEGWGQSVADVDEVPVTGTPPRVATNLEVLEEFRKAVASSGSRKVQKLISPQAEFVFGDERRRAVEGRKELVEWIVRDPQRSRISTKPRMVVAGRPGFLVAYVEDGAHVWRIREGKVERWQWSSDVNRAREKVGLPTETQAAALLERYSPVIQYDSQESYAADSPATMTDCDPAGSERGNLLRASDGSTIASVRPGSGAKKLELDFLRSGKYPDGTKVSPDDYLDAVGKQYVVDSRAMHARPCYGDHVYGHAVCDSDGNLWLQYWFFYYYNNKAFLFNGLHEGDWEMIQLRLDPDGDPDVVAYAQHTRGERCEWDEVELDRSSDGPVPVVYSARGSHASYFRRGVYPEAPVVPDHNDAQGPRVRPKLTVVDDDEPAWVAWPGRWGNTKAKVGPIGANSPRGPREHEAWRDPLAFYTAAAPARELGPVAGSAVAVPAPPQIEARREGDRAVIAYRIPDAQEGPRAARLVLSVDAHGDGKPPATGSWAIKAPAGEIEFPLALEDHDYVIRASTASEEGLTSATVDVPLAGTGHRE
jgi:hypothetical protein